MRFLAALVLLAVVLALLALATRRDLTPFLVDASADCAPAKRLPNPCDTINCNKPDTRKIA